MGRSAATSASQTSGASSANAERPLGVGRHGEYRQPRPDCQRCQDEQACATIQVEQPPRGSMHPDLRGGWPTCAVGYRRGACASLSQRSSDSHMRRRVSRCDVSIQFLELRDHCRILGRSSGRFWAAPKATDLPQDCHSEQHPQNAPGTAGGAADFSAEVVRGPSSRRLRGWRAP